MVHAVIPEGVEGREGSTAVIIDVPRLEQEVRIEGADCDAALGKVKLDTVVADQSGGICRKRRTEGDKVKNGSFCGEMLR